MNPGIVLGTLSRKSLLSLWIHRTTKIIVTRIRHERCHSRHTSENKVFVSVSWSIFPGALAEWTFVRFKAFRSSDWRRDCFKLRILKLTHSPMITLISSSDESYQRQSKFTFVSTIKVAPLISPIRMRLGFCAHLDEWSTEVVFGQPTSEPLVCVPDTQPRKSLSSQWVNDSSLCDLFEHVEKFPGDHAAQLNRQTSDRRQW